MDVFSPHLFFVERRAEHYSNLQQILLVGEGDFSFSNALAIAFGSGRNLVATSLDSQDELHTKYTSVGFTVSNLKRLGALIFHGVDATRMAAHVTICHLSFDRIVYNFPHAGFSGAENDKKVIRRHKRLVKLFFLNAAKLLRRNGEVHVAHKVKAPYCDWKLEKQAAKSGLVLKECCDFDPSRYPGYKNKRGDGAHCDDTFHLGACSTFKFALKEPSLFSRFCFLPSRVFTSASRVAPFGALNDDDRHGPVSLKRPREDNEQGGSVQTTRCRFLKKIRHFPGNVWLDPTNTKTRSSCQMTVPEEF